MSNQISVGFEIKALSKHEFEGHGAIFGNIDMGGDVVLPGAFNKSLAEHKRAGALPQMFWMHDAAQVPGIWKEMHEDGDGLFVKGELVDTQLGKEMHTLLSTKAVRGLSIGFRVIDAEFDGDGIRKLKEIDLWEVSLVSLAMNPLAQIEAIKSRLSASGEYVPTTREFERILRNAGCSKKTALTLCSRLFDSHPGGMLDGGRRDSETVDPDELDALEKTLSRIQDSAWKSVFRI